MATARPQVKTQETLALEGRLPPQNLDAERSLLGCVLLLSESIDEIGELTVAEHFYSDAHQKIFTAVKTLYDRGSRGIDPVTVAEVLSQKNELEEVGGVPYLLEILDTVPHAAHARYYANIVRDKWVQRKLIYACNEILKDCYHSSKETDDLMGHAESRIFQILEQQNLSEKIAIKDILMDAWDRINDRSNMEGEITGLETGFRDFDKKTSGLQPSELIILAARPSMGKTALVCNVAEGVARLSGRGVLMFSLEQSRLDLAERLMCMRAKVDGMKVRSGEIDDRQRHKLLEATNDLNALPIMIDDRAGRSVSQINAIARRAARRIKQSHKVDLGLIIIDYLQLIEPEDKRVPREQQISTISRQLKFISKELDIPVIALSQLNRGVEMREDKRPRLSDLRESGAIEQDADLIMFLHRPDAYDPEDRPGEAELILAKHRSGPTGIVPLTWRKEYMRFEDYSFLQEPDGGYQFGADVSNDLGPPPDLPPFGM